MTRKLLSGVIRVTISFTLIGLLLFIMRRQLTDVFTLLLNVSVPKLLAAILLSLVSYFFLAIRLRLFLVAQRIKISVKEAVGLTLIGLFFNNFLPTAIGGDVVKAYYASKKTSGRLHSFTSVFMDRFIGSFTLVLVALFAFTLLGNEERGKIVVWPLWALFLIAVFFLSLLFNKKVVAKISEFRMFKWVKKLHSSLMAFKGKRFLFARAFGVSLVAQLFHFFMIYVIIKSLYGFVPLIKILLLMPIVSMISMCPSINGLGLREGAFLLLFKPLIGAEKAFALALLWLFIFILISISGGLIYAFAKHGKKEVYT